MAGEGTCSLRLRCPRKTYKRQLLGFHLVTLKFTNMAFLQGEQAEEGFADGTGGRKLKTPRALPSWDAAAC